MPEDNITVLWGAEAAVWVATGEDIPRLVLESGSLDALTERVRNAVPPPVLSGGPSPEASAGAGRSSSASGLPPGGPLMQGGGAVFGRDGGLAVRNMSVRCQAPGARASRLQQTHPNPA
jgi:hypothetical protein